MAMASPLSPRQQSSLQTVVNTILPPLKEETSQGKQSYDLSKDNVFLAALTETIATKLSATEYSQLSTVLSLLGTTVGTCLVFGTLSTAAFSNATLEQRTALLHDLQHSRLHAKRNLYQSLKRLVCGLAYSFVDTSTNQNPFWSAMGYPGPPPIKEETQREDFDTGALLEITQDTILDCDVVIVVRSLFRTMAHITFCCTLFHLLILNYIVVHRDLGQAVESPLLSWHSRAIRW